MDLTCSMVLVDGLYRRRSVSQDSAFRTHFTKRDSDKAEPMKCSDAELTN
jgi:hypothetical protein